MRVPAVLLWLACGVAAAVPARAQSRCDAVDGMLSVDEDDRQFVRALCEMSNGDAELWKQAQSDRAEGERLARLARRLTETSRADATVLGAVLPAGILPIAESVITCSPKAYADAFDAALIRVRSDRSEDRRVGTLALHHACADVSAKDTAPIPSSSSGVRPWTILAPEKSDVRLLIGGQVGGLWLVKEAELQCAPSAGARAGADGCKDELVGKHAGLVPYTAMVPLGVPYVAIVGPEPKPEAELVREAVVAPVQRALRLALPLSYHAVRIAPSRNRS